MASTPLYKSLKENSTTFYCFPSAAEDLSASHQNPNYKMNFTKFALLNLPKQNLSDLSNPIQFDFDNSDEFYQDSTSIASPVSFAEQLIESLRNYMANQEVLIKESRINDNEFFYDNNNVRTNTERIFWKWCRKLNLMQFEVADGNDEFFKNLPEFESNKITDNNYFPEVLWKERETTDWSITSVEAFSGTLNGTVYNNILKVVFHANTNFRAGDIVTIKEITNSTFTSLNGTRTPVIFASGNIAYLNRSFLSPLTNLSAGKATLVYNRLVQYVGEITGTNNVQQANKAYIEVYAHVPANVGMTPDILFRTLSDVNYKPNLVFPILPSQIQSEILGAENINSPIVQLPQNYPGDYFGHFDTSDFTYETSDGDLLRRSGDYYGVYGNTSSPTYSPLKLDGISLDLDLDHYVKANIVGKEVSNFNDFSAMFINNLPPQGFEFNAVLWYYDVEDSKGNTSTNLYGISFIESPNINDADNYLKVPTWKKTVEDGVKDGTAYILRIVQNIYVSSDTPIESADRNSSNGSFNFEAFLEAMRKLSSLNDAALGLLNDNIGLALEVQQIKQLLYSQTDINIIKKKMGYLEELLKTLQTLQLSSSDTIKVSLNNSVSPPLVELENIDPGYHSVVDILTSNLYDASGVIPYNVSVPDQKNFYVRVTNNDVTNLKFKNANDRLTLLLSRDLDYRQSVEISIDGILSATENKKLDILVNYNSGVPNALDVPTVLIDKIDLPIYYNSANMQQNSATYWDSMTRIPLTLTDGSSFSIGTDYFLILNGPTNGIVQGDYLYLHNFVVNTGTPVAPALQDFSGQYKVTEAPVWGSNVFKLDVSSNADFVKYVDKYTSSNNIGSFTFPINPNPAGSGYNSTYNILSATPHISVNRGYKIKITRVSPSENSSIKERYAVEKIAF